MQQVDISAHIDRLMKARGYNWRTLAKAAALGDTTVRDIINGRSGSPTMRTLDKIAAPLGYTDGIAMLLDRPALDAELLTDAVVETLAFNDTLEDTLSPEEIARLVGVIYEHYARSPEARAPDALRRDLELLRKAGTLPA